MQADEPNLDQQLRAIAFLVNSVRPDWHTQGVLAVLRDCPTGDVASTAIAALAATRRRDQRTPALIALDGPHWRLADASPASRTTPTPPRYEPQPRKPSAPMPPELRERIRNLR